MKSSGEQSEPLLWPDESEERFGELVVKECTGEASEEEVAELGRLETARNRCIRLQNEELGRAEVWELFQDVELGVADLTIKVAKLKAWLKR